MLYAEYGKIFQRGNAFFALLAVLGIANDPTTQGISDSKLAMTYSEPKGKE